RTTRRCVEWRPRCRRTPMPGSRSPSPASPLRSALRSRTSATGWLPRGRPLVLEAEQQLAEQRPELTSLVVVEHGDQALLVGQVAGVEPLLDRLALVGP